MTDFSVIIDVDNLSNIDAYRHVISNKNKNIHVKIVESIDFDTAFLILWDCGSRSTLPFITVFTEWTKFTAKRRYSRDETPLRTQKNCWSQQ